MANLAQQPLEVLHQILSLVRIEDFPNLALTCRHLHRFIAKDDLLWKGHYLKLFDEPSLIPESWQDASKKNIRFQKLLLEERPEQEKKNDLEWVANTAIDLLTTTTSSRPIHNQAFLAALFMIRSNKSAFLSRSSLFHRAGLPFDEPAESEELRQLSAKLHVFYGKEVELSLDESSVNGAQLIHPCARSRVYDLRRYKRKNYWGPFMDDGSGRVDWEKVQSIMIVLARGLDILSQAVSTKIGLFRDEVFYGLAPNSYQSLSQRVELAEDEDSLAAKDPYGVTGTWMRVVNFLDYHDLFAFNFQPPILPANQEREPITTREAIRLIVLKLNVKRIDEPGQCKDPQVEDIDPSMPVVFFEGTSRSLSNSFDPNANSKVRGFVRTTKHGDIRWTTFSVFAGEERWRSESVQIGGIRSARGTIGNWFDKDFDAHGPAGPTAFWKWNDDTAEPDADAEDEWESDSDDDDDDIDLDADDVEEVVVVEEEETSDEDHPHVLFEVTGGLGVLQQ